MNQPSFTIAQVPLLAILVSTGACRTDDRRETSTNFDNYKPLAAAVAEADKVVLYEGLPHQAFERNLLDEELKTKKTVQHDGFPFYAEALQLKEADAKELTRLFTDASSFQPFTGHKKCGGFHPDYCIEWHVGPEVYRCLVCFGCHEVKVFGPKAGLYCDIRNQAYDKFKEVLQPYRKQRPEPNQE
jgi:hypothetical protein